MTREHADLFDGVEWLDDIRAIHDRMEKNCPQPWSKSKALWKLRRATSISSHNPSKETMLERSVAILADKGRMPGWFNQCPAASGIGDSFKYRHHNVDLVHWSEADGTARLVELKWKSDDAEMALAQILRYGATYVFCRRHREELPLGNRPLMAARRVSLEVVAPAVYYQGSGVERHLHRMREAVDRFDVGSLIPGLSMSLDARAFPVDFALPFATAGEVKELCGGKDWTDPARRVRAAFDNLAPARSA